MTRNSSGWRRPAGARALILLAVANFTLSGCVYSLSTKLAITVTNNTDEDLTVRLNGHISQSVGAGDTTGVGALGARSECLSGGVTATTGDLVAPDWSAAPGSLEATMPPPICDGDTWVIEDSDLVPIGDADTTPAPSPSP